jgi:hypothetical protein
MGLQAAALDLGASAGCATSVPFTWESAVADLPSLGSVAGLLYLQVGAAWPPYVSFILRAASANAAISFYFLGPELDTSACPNCFRLPLDEAFVLERIETQLNITRDSVQLAPRKLCDLKPMWPAMFPELASRHAWIGYSDYDILYGNLASEVANLQDSDEMLVCIRRLYGVVCAVRNPPSLLFADARSVHRPGRYQFRTFLSRSQTVTCSWCAALAR